MYEGMKYSPCPSTVKLPFRKSVWLIAHVPTVASSPHTCTFLLVHFLKGKTLNIFFLETEEREEVFFAPSVPCWVCPSVYPCSSLFTQCTFKNSKFFSKTVCLCLSCCLFLLFSTLMLLN